jgi:ribulose-phosphate 3-epimerase
MAAIAPSILSADFSKLGQLVTEVDRAGADRIHIDVMDGHFVPNLSMGPVVVRGLRPVTKLPLEVHLMVDDPARFADAFLNEGANTLIVHQEVLPEPWALFEHVHARGGRVGMAIKPETPVEALRPYLTELDLALCMTVHPGFGGQAFLPDSPERIRALRKLIERINPACELEVDGGIDRETAPVVVQSGATVLVAGMAVFGDPAGPAAGVQALRAAARA